jgi:hypothetical protein
MSNEKTRRTPLMNQLLLLLMGAMLVYLVVSFARQVTISHHQTADLNHLEEQIRIASAEKIQLEEYRDYVWSIEALEWFGRQFGWSRPDEQIVVPYGLEAGAAAPEAETLEDGAEPGSPQDAWLELFFATQ